MEKKVFVVLENGKKFEGTAFGASLKENVLGELVFNTNVVGFVEMLTDPNYYNQILVETFPLVGSYGAMPEDMQSKKCFLKALICREWCPEPSNFRALTNINEFLKEQGVVGVCGLDTRALTSEIRINGTIKAVICTEPAGVVFGELSDTGAVKDASVDAPENFVLKKAAYKVGVLDFGSKNTLTAALLKRGADVIKLPYNTSVKDIKSYGFDGIVLSDGPGNPKSADVKAEVIKELGNTPILAIGLGHCLLALAYGGDTFKMKVGHRGGNQPIKDVKTGKILLCSQNHGYAVCDAHLPKGATVVYTNVNDNSVEGLEYDDKKIISVQFDLGEENTIYDKFVQMMEGNNNDK